MDQYSSSSSPVNNVSPSTLGSQLTEVLNEQHESSISDAHNGGDQEDVYLNDDVEEDDEDLTAEILAQSGYGKIVGDQECMCEDEKEVKSELAYAEDETSSHSRKSWPSDKKLVSAFKGSREKEGLLDREVRVTWAPDVYDPPITSDDHFLQDKTEKHKGGNKKQKGKQKREGKSAREEKGKGKGKDKKQTRKHSGSSKK